MPSANTIVRMLALFPLLVLPGCLLTAISEEALSGGGAGDHALFVDGAGPDAHAPDAFVPDSSAQDRAVRDDRVADSAAPDTAVRDSAVPDSAIDDASGRIVLFSDDYESGGIANWTLSQPNNGNPWTASPIDPATGSYAARVQPSETTDPASAMEHAISTNGHQGIHFEYDRKLVEFDLADRFRASWFDGATWFALEQTGTVAINDLTYSHRSFALPAAAENKPAFRIRFECTAGAVSEFCNVDNVAVWASQ